MSTIEQKLNALAVFVLAEDPAEKETARKALCSVLKAGSFPEIEPLERGEETVHQFLFELGADPSLIGYKYAAYGILQIAMHPNLIDSITHGFYPKVAIQFDTTPSRVERAIRHFIEMLWQRGDMDELEKHFGASLLTDDGKPTSGRFLARSALIIRTKLKK